jgi:hypothetical protein
VTTTKEITALLSRNLGVDVAPYAARLVSEVMADIESQKVEQ